MIMWIIIGASAFSSVYSAVGGHKIIASISTAVPGGRWGVIILIQIIYFLLGMILDPSGIQLITIPIFVPLIKSLGFDPVWFGVLLVLMSEMALISPPVGINAFVVQGIAKDVPLDVVFRGVMPFIAVMAIGVAILVAFPQISLFLPNLMQ